MPPLRHFTRISAFLWIFSLIPACTGDRLPPADKVEGTAADSTEWLTVEESGKRVTIRIAAGSTADNSYWNLNGFHGGTGTIVVPLGWDVVIDFENADPQMPHSLGVDRRTSAFPTDFAPIEPAFLGASSPSAGKEGAATAPGEWETLRFRADVAGEYTLLCYVPGHAAVGQFMAFHVVDGAEAGFIR